jgi:DUF1680 family protein
MPLGRPLPLTGVKITDPFWSYWQTTVIEKTLPRQWQMCEETGRIENFRRVARGENANFEGIYYNDSDVYKWMEAASYALLIDPNSSTKQHLDEAINLVNQAQDASGYLHTYHQLGRMDEQYGSLVCKHEMYCGGHLIEAGVAHQRATGTAALSDAARFYAQHIAETFGPHARRGWCGHQEIELALCRLADLDGNEKWRDLARWMTLGRGTRPSPYQEELETEIGNKLSPTYYDRMFKQGKYDGAYCQDDVPLQDQSLPVGHSVRAMYFYCGAHDSFPNGMPPELQAAMTRIWRSLIDKRIYVTGGIGSSRHNEGFTSDYDLPNRDAYAETCAGISLLFWASRMNDMTGDSEPADVMERVLYNAALSGISLDGERYYYVNPLERLGAHERQPWYACACCPPNIARLILSLGQYLGRHDENSLTINLYVGATLDLGEFKWAMESALPWEGHATLRVLEGSGHRTLRLRIPGWAAGFTIRLNGHIIPAGVAHGYVEIERDWSPGDMVSVDFPMPVTFLEANPHITEGQGKVAVFRGPLLYCLEEADLGAPTPSFAIHAGRSIEIVDIDPALAPAQKALRIHGRVHDTSWDGPALYRLAALRNPWPASATLIPYFAWANRVPGTMQVWLPRAD